MFRKYTSEEFSELKESPSDDERGKQHNILMLVGNGFDIDMLSKRGKSPTSYSQFFGYLEGAQGFDKNNILYKRMCISRKNGEENWSDFESRLGEYLHGDFVDYEKLRFDLNDIQEEFSRFLDKNVDTGFLRWLGEESREKHLAAQTFSKFLGDLSKGDLKNSNLARNSHHYDLYYFSVLNFNYTSILDNYLYLDKDQFDPLPHRTIDTNSKFYPDPRLFLAEGVRSPTVTENSTYLMYEIHHPHGFQDIPRSLLFGVSDVRDYPNEREASKFSKTYWAQNEKRYLKYFDDVETIIIYGMSLGESDSWWWRNVIESLVNNYHAELIIYYYDPKGEKSHDEVREEFLLYTSQDNLSMIRNKIYINKFSNSDDNYAFSLVKK